MARANCSVFSGQHRGQFDTQPDVTPVVKPERHVHFADEVTVAPDPEPQRQQDSNDEDMIDTDPGSPIDEPEDEKQETSSVTGSTTTTHSEDEDWDSGRSQSLGSKAIHRREGWGDFGSLPRRAQRRRGESSIPYPRGHDLRFEAQRRSTVNRARAEYRAGNPERFNEAFLGSDCCNLCGEAPKHSNASECAVYYYRTHGRLPQQCTIPCLYCECPRHTTDACEFLHARCTRCGFRGHMKFECKSRTVQEWLVAYLDCVHLGKLTRENPHGPLEGRWGFGNVDHLDIAPDLWELVDFKRKSMELARKRTRRGQPHFNPIKEAQLNWNLVLQRHDALTRRERELERRWAVFEEERARWRAEMSQQRQRRPLTHSMGCQTDPGTDGGSSPTKRRRQ